MLAIDSSVLIDLLGEDRMADAGEAALRAGLITRDDELLRDYFKGLKIIVPGQA